MDVSPPLETPGASGATPQVRVEIDESNAYRDCDWHGGAVLTDDDQVYPFGAKEMRKPSLLGIEGGRIVFLVAGTADDAIEFECGWKRRPRTKEGRAVLAAILARFSYPRG